MLEALILSGAAFVIFLYLIATKADKKRETYMYVAKDEFFFGVQTFCEEIGEAACYALQLCRIAILEAGVHKPVVSMLLDCIDSKYVHYNSLDPEDNDNFFVKDAEKLLEFLTKKKVIVRKVDGDSYSAAPGEYVIWRWERKTPKGTFSHFASDDWDSLANSLTVKYGKKVSARVVKFV